MNGVDWGWGGEAGNSCPDDQEEEAIDALGKGWAASICHRCGGQGHFARECATPAGTVDVAKGRTGKGGAKGKALGGKKGGGKGGGAGPWGGKGKGKDGWSSLSKGGKGYQGRCYHCGEIGHKANEGRCGWAVQKVAVEGEETQIAEMGSVWSICHVGIKADERTAEKWQAHLPNGQQEAARGKQQSRTSLQSKVRHDAQIQRVAPEVAGGAC